MAQTQLQKSPRLLRILVPSIGGQGGGVVTEILHTALVIEREKVAKEKGVWDALAKRTDLEARYMVPGLAQRSGSVFTSIACVSPDETELPEGEMLFSERVFTGSVDLMIVQEVAEAMRFVKAGYLRRDSVVITNEHRVFTTVEKMPSAGPMVKMEDMVAAMKKLCKTYVGIDASEVTGRLGLKPVTANTILLGIVSATKALPVRRESYVEALKQKFSGPVLEENLKAFGLGEKYHELVSMRREAKIDILQQSFNAIVERNKAILKERKRGREALAYERYCREVVQKYPEGLWNILAEAIGQLIDYEGWHHVRLYMGYVDEIIGLDKKHGDGSFALTREYAKHFAGRIFKWEGPYEVARLKALRKYEVKKGTIIKVETLLQPNLEEVYGMFPWKMHSLLRAIIPWWEGFLHRNRFRGYPSTINVTSLHGFLFFKLMGGARFLHKHSVRYRRELEKIRHYTDEITRRAEVDYGLGVILATYIQNIKGFAHVREHNFECFDSLMGLMDLCIEIDRDWGNRDYSTAKGAFLKAKSFVTLDGEGKDKIVGLHSALKELYGKKDSEGVYRLLGMEPKREETGEV